jgi:hypothetical protein
VPPDVFRYCRAKLDLFACRAVCCPFDFRPGIVSMPSIPLMKSTGTSSMKARELKVSSTMTPWTVLRYMPKFPGVVERQERRLAPVPVEPALTPTTCVHLSTKSDNISVQWILHMAPHISPSAALPPRGYVGSDLVGNL